MSNRNITVMDGVKATIGYEIAQLIILLIKKSSFVIFYIGMMFLMAEVASQVTGKNQLTGEVRKPVHTEVYKKRN